MYVALRLTIPHTILPAVYFFRRRRHADIERSGFYAAVPIIRQARSLDAAPVLLCYHVAACRYYLNMEDSN